MPVRPSVLTFLAWAGLFWQIAVSGAGAAPKAELPIVPAGFEIELVAGPPLVEHPTMGGFDPQGRLYVCDGPGINLPAKDLLQQLPNKIVRLEDTDGDGRFDRSRPYAEKMTFPMGALWYRGSIYTASPPNIWKLTDADNDGVAERREILVSEFGFTGNAADIHGCFLHPGGRLYWCDGRHGHNFVDEHGNQISKGLAARLFNCRVDGKQVESFAGGGMDNPVEVTFTAEGEPLGTVAIFDTVGGRHDALVHWVYGGVYPHYQQVLPEFKRTGDLLPALSRFGQVAPSGVERMRSERFGPEYRDNIFLAEFDTHCVVRTQIVREGATFRSRDEDFLTSANQDFHPTDVIEDADGSLLVIDTGGWFRIGCPLSQIAKPEIRGGIYRIRRSGTKSPVDPRGLKLAWQNADIHDLLGRLTDGRFAVRERALDELAARGKMAIDPLHQFRRTSPDARARGLAVWALARIDAPEAREPVRLAMTDRDASVRQIAVHSIGTRRDTEAFDLLCELVESDAPQIRRDAATALGRLGQRGGVPVLLSSLRTVAGDRFLEHALIYALIQLNDRQATAAGLADKSAEVRRSALIALDQMPDSQLTREQVVPLFDTSDAALQKVVIAIIERHPGWAAETVGVLGKWLDDSDASPQRTEMLHGALLAFAHEAQLQQLVARSLGRAETPVERQVLLLDVIGRADLPELPASWAEQLSRHLAAHDPRVVRQAVATVAARRSDRFDEQLSAVARDARQSDDVRFAALVLVAKDGGGLDRASFELLLKKLGEDTDPVDRLTAAEGLGAAALTAAQLQELVPKVAAAGPLELPALVRAFEKNRDAALALRLIAALEKSSGSENLSLDALKKLLAPYPAEVQRAAQPLVSRLSAGVEQQRSRLAELAGLLEGGNPARGRQIFFDKRASCSACHRARGEGATIGPDLSKIGQIRAKADLLEAVVFPSASFSRGYESFSIVTDRGQVYTGILGRQTPDSVYLRTAQREEVRINRSEIEHMAPAKVSIMPQGFDKVLSPDELRDVFAFLQSLK